MLGNIIRSLFTKGIVALINVIILIVSSRYLGVSSRGEISIFILNLAIIQGVSGIYTGYNIVYEVTRQHLTRLATGALAFTIIVAAAANALILMFHKQVEGYDWYVYLTAILVIYNTFNCMVILGKQNISLFNRLSVLQPLLLLLGMLVCIFLYGDFTFTAYYLPLNFSFLVAIIFSTIALFRLSSEEKNKNFNLRSVLAKGLTYQSGVLLYLFCSRFCFYLLPGKQTVGLYSSAVLCAEAALIVVTGIAPLLVSKVANSENHENKIKITLALGKFGFLACLGILVVLLAVPESWLVYILGSGFIGIKQLISIYSPGVLLVSLFSPLVSYYSAQGKQKITLLAFFAGFVVILFLAPWMVQQYNAGGAALATILSFGVMASVLLTVFAWTNKLSRADFFSLSSDWILLKNTMSGERSPR